VGHPEGVRKPTPALCPYGQNKKPLFKAVFCFTSVVKKVCRYRKEKFDAKKICRFGHLDIFDTAFPDTEFIQIK
jgi:hypothetical protein